jgi:hypothetical protein
MVKRNREPECQRIQPGGAERSTGGPNLGAARRIARRARASDLGVRALLVAALLACGSPARDPDSPPVTRAFYYWRTTFALSAAEQRALAATRTATLYVRAFDVVWNATERRAELVGRLTGYQPPPGVTVIPVVFLRQEVFTQLPSTQPLAAQVGAEALRLVPGAREVQLDCDWTDRSRDRFFAFLREVRAATKLSLSATIRLHQVKYRERTGVPPVERGMLMYYNMGAFSAESGKRAIFDGEAAARYLARIADYPLPLDLALPIWSWTVHARDGVVVDLLQSTDPDELPALDFLRATSPDTFSVTRTAILHGAVLREGDVLKVERMTPAETLGAARQVAPHLRAGARTIALFDLSERNLTRYGTDQLEDIFALR